MGVGIDLKKPSDCRADELAEFGRLAEESKQVARHGLSKRIANAKTLAFAPVGNRVAGIAALKLNEPHRISVFKAAKLVLPTSDFFLEFGWLYVDPAYRRRGIGDALMDRALASVPGEGVFATIRSTNADAHRLHSQRGFVRAGESYPGDEAGSWIELWMRSAQSEENLSR